MVVSTSIESKEDGAQTCIAILCRFCLELWSTASESFEEGLTPEIEIMDDIVKVLSVDNDG